ncbi:MAG: primosomal protein N', partial [Coleofasciculus sp. C2-GNP5-27]
LNNRQVGAIAIRLLASPPADVPLAKIREVDEVIGTGFFENSYWQVLERVAQYYCTPLISVVRGALPPGLLMRSQRRVRLHREAVPDGADTFVGRTARQILALLDAQPEGDYSVAYLQRQVKGARRGVKDLLKRGWVESYLKPPQPSRPKQKKAVTLVADRFDADVTERQREVLDVLRRRGGDLWLNELLQVCHATSSIVNKLAEKGYVVVEYREILRTLDQPNVADDRAKVLTEKQTYALQTIQGLDEFSQVLLHGVTGSGKTEVYLQAIAPLLRAGKSALVLVPEIGLTPQLTDRFRARFGKKVNVYHSGLSHGERYDTWRQVLSGEPQVVIGTRSAIFVPLPKLGLIILDEEHDSSFKQDSLPPTYHARTVAQWRAELENCPLVLGSATPSLETWVSVNDQPANRNPDAPCKTYYLSLPERIQSRPLPPVEIVDMRQEFKQGNRSIFSRSLQDGLQQLKQKQRQGILFIPRRGHSTFVS